MGALELRIAAGMHQYEIFRVYKYYCRKGRTQDGLLSLYAVVTTTIGARFGRSSTALRPYDSLRHHQAAAAALRHR